MFGTSQSTSGSFSETWDLLPYQDDDEVEDAIDQGKVLSADELIERLKNIENIFDSKQSGRGYSPEAFALLCTLLTCVSWGKENRALFTSLATLIDTETATQDSVVTSSTNVLHDAQNVKSTDTHDDEAAGVSVYTMEDEPQSIFSNCKKDIKSLLFVNTLCRGPPLLRDKNGNSDYVFAVTDTLLIDISGMCGKNLNVIFVNNEKQYLQNRLYSNSLHNQANRRQFL